MKLDKVNGNYNQNFGIRLVRTPEVNEYMKYIERSPKSSNYMNYEFHSYLYKKIEEALAKHPANIDIVPSVIYRKNELFNARGVLQTNKFKIVDVEPARSDSGVAPIENVLRKILSPQNQEAFDVLVGKEYSEQYQVWWNKHIAPLWFNIDTLYREKTIDISDSALNKAFLKQLPTSKKISFIDKIKSIFKLGKNK